MPSTGQPLNLSMTVSNNFPQVSAAIMNVMIQEFGICTREVINEIRDYNTEGVSHAWPQKNYRGHGFPANAPLTVALKQHSVPLIGYLNNPRILSSKRSYGTRFVAATVTASVWPLARLYRDQQGNVTGTTLEDVIRYVNMRGYDYWGIPTTPDFEAKVTIKMIEAARRAIARLTAMNSVAATRIP